MERTMEKIDQLHLEFAKRIAVSSFVVDNYICSYGNESSNADKGEKSCPSERLKNWTNDVLSVKTCTGPSEWFHLKFDVSISPRDSSSIWKTPKNPDGFDSSVFLNVTAFLQLGRWSMWRLDWHVHCAHGVRGERAVGCQFSIQTNPAWSGDRIQCYL